MIKQNVNLDVDQSINDVVARLDTAGYETYIVGGAVRDLLLGRLPKDYDLVTAAQPLEIKKLFGRKKTALIGRRFQLVHLYIGDDYTEICTFRKTPEKTVKSANNRKYNNLPQNMIIDDNEFGTVEEDAQRRDFTVNALYYNPMQKEIHDHAGKGIQDLHHGIVRSVGDAMLRFEEDPVRMLRALKLVGEYSFKLESDTDKALRQSSGLIVFANSSRLTLELEKILHGTSSDKILTVFHEYGLLKYFLPYVDETWDTPNTQYMLELLRERNERILKQNCPQNLSLVVALMAMPHIEHLLGKGKEFCSPNNRDIKIAEVSNIIRQTFQPHDLIDHEKSVWLYKLLSIGVDPFDAWRKLSVSNAASA